MNTYLICICNLNHMRLYRWNLTNSCEISCKVVERRGTSLYWIHSYSKRSGSVPSPFQLVGCLPTFINMDAPDVPLPPEAGGVDR